MNGYGLSKGTVRIRSAGPITFGPAGILFMADNAAARIVAVDVGDRVIAGPPAAIGVDNVDVRASSFLGCTPSDLKIRDLAVHPDSHCVYLSVQRGHGEDGQQVLLRLDPTDASLTDVDLTGVPMAAVSIDDAPDADDERLDTSVPFAKDEGQEVTFGERTVRILRQPIRTATVTDMAYVDGYLLVAGLSNEEFSSKFRRIPFPFGKDPMGTNLEIFHVSHGKWETAAPIRTFVPYEGGRAILAGYTCTPVVHFSLDDLQPGTKTVGRTVAELGSMNQPLGMVTFRDEGGEHLLVSNTRHGLIKIACADIAAQEPLTQHKEPIGVSREVEDLTGITLLDRLGDEQVLALQVDESGRQHLRSLKTSSL